MNNVEGAAPSRTPDGRRTTEMQMAIAYPDELSVLQTEHRHRGTDVSVSPAVFEL
jgi:hypothetical protein